jgi:hypothetical protein
MFGSDQMVWPGAAQKRDILYNNAARFLRLSKEEMARHRSP